MCNICKYTNSYKNMSQLYFYIIYSLSIVFIYWYMYFPLGTALSASSGFGCTGFFLTQHKIFYNIIRCMYLSIVISS